MCESGVLYSCFYRQKALLTTLLLCFFCLQAKAQEQADTIRHEKTDTLSEITVRPDTLKLPDFLSGRTRDNLKIGSKTSLLPDSWNDVICHPFAWKERKRERKHKKDKKILRDYDMRKTDNELLREALEREGLLEKVEEKKSESK